VNAGFDLKNLFDGFEGAAEKAQAEFLEVGTSKGDIVEINALVKRVDFD